MNTPALQAKEKAQRTQQLSLLQEIFISGSVTLGQELNLRQFPARVETTPQGVPIRNVMGERIDYRLVSPPQADVVRIEDDGFKTGFGIFGAPGSGKTHLVLHILRGILENIDRSPNGKFGGLILDPKAALLGEVAKMWATLGPHRANDLIIIKPDFLNYLQALDEQGQIEVPPGFDVFERLGLDLSAHPRDVNVIDCALSPTELGKMLVLAAQSAGVSAKEPFWFLAWSNLFSAALTLLEYSEIRVPTLSVLMEQIMYPDPSGREVPDTGKGSSGMRRQRMIETLSERVSADLHGYSQRASERMGLSHRQIETDLALACSQLDSFFRADYLRTIEAFISNAFGGFQQSKFAQLSRPGRRLSQKYGTAAGRSVTNLYDDIIENGKVVLVSAGPEDPVMGKVLCTLVKCLFQQSVMSRLERFITGKLKNFQRPVFIACDEYAEVASEVPGQPMGDGRFFSLSRQNACMGILATQSIHTLENSSLSESWKSIFSNLAAKVFMGAADNETAEQASKLAGQIDWEMTSTTESFGKDNSFSHQRSYQQRPELSPYILTHVLAKGEAAVIGSLDGRKTAPMLRFLKVPGRYI